MKFSSVVAPRFKSRFFAKNRQPYGRLTTGLALTFLIGCGDSDKPTDQMPSPSSAESPLADTSFGFVAVEPIEEDGSATGVDVAPNLVERYSDVREALPMLDEAKVSVALMVQAHKLDVAEESDAFFKLVEDIVARGLQVVPVPVLSADQGYFPNATNVDTYVPVVRKLVSGWKEHGLDPTMLVVDMEPPRELTEALGSLDLAKAVPKDHIDRDRYAAGAAAYAALADELHAAGWKVGVTTQASLLADYRDDDDDLRQYFNVVLDGVKWDQIDFQLYRSAYESQAPGLDSYFVYDFARTAIAQYPGITVGVGLGLTHPGPVFPGTNTFASSKSLRDDVEAAVAAGVKREQITVYNLKGILLGPPKCEKVLSCKPSEYKYQTNDPRSWFVHAEPGKVPSDALSTKALWEQLDLMDGLLDLSEDSQSGL
jgi:hypothetical protein